MRFLYGLVAAATICCVAEQVSCQCIFGATFNSKTWRDNTKGTLKFITTTMTGWNFKSTKTTGTSTISPTWQCVNHTSDDYLVLRTRNKFTYERLYQTTPTIQVYAYMCLKLTNITDYSFIYYQQEVQDIKLGGERLKVSTSPDLHQEHVCDTTVSIPTPEYHVLVLSGNESNAAIQCPDSLLITADYYYVNNDNSTACEDTGDSLLDVCADKTRPNFNYTICSQPVAFSANGLFYCVASVSYSGYDYTTVYNLDTTITSTERRFSCICKSGTYMSVAPNNCTSYQNPFEYPLLADQTTATGHRLVIQKQYSYCGSTVTNTTGLTAGEIAAIVVSLLLLLYIWTVSTIVLIAVAFFTLRIIFVLLLEFTDVTDHIPVTKPPTSVTPDLLKHKTDIDRGKSPAGPESVHVHVNSSVKEPIKEKEKVHNGQAKKGDNKETKGEQQTVNENKTSLEAVNSDSKDKSPRSKPFIV